MYEYPLVFKVSASAISGVQENWTSTAETDPEQPILMAIPEEFKGPGGAISPEDLYGMALVNCFVATFKVIAEASKFTFEKLDADLSFEVDKNEKGQPWVARAHMTAKLYGPSSPDKAVRLMEKASQNCLIINSVNTEKTYTFEVL